jgi:hypothetical protein
MADKFSKSTSNARTQKIGLGILLGDPRFQEVDLATKRVILKQVVPLGEYGPQSFDCVMTPGPVEALTAENVLPHLATLRLIEMKTTRKPIRNAALNQFFFGATAREFDLAQALGDRFLFAFVVLNTANEFGRPFAVLLTHDQVVERTRTKRVQFQVNFRSDTDPRISHSELVLLDSEILGPTSDEPDPRRA